MSARSPRIVFGFLATLALSVPRPMVAQSQALAGLVVDSLTGEPLAGTIIQVFWDESRIAGTVSNRRGEFRLPDLSGGPFTVAVNRVGYRAVRIKARI